MSDLETVERIAALETQYVKDQMLIDRLNRRNAELLDALKKVRGMEPWIGDSNVLEFFQKTVYTAIEKAETFNNSKQTT